MPSAEANPGDPGQESAASFPLKEFLGFDLEQGEGRATATLEVTDRHLNPNGVAHGAVAFALMDTAMGGAVMSVVPAGSRCATIEIHTRYHAAASTGTLRAEATITSGRKRIVHLQARTLDGEGRLVASATGSFAVMAPDPTRPEVS
jgi:acyl-CoA thioesterase